MVQLAQVQSEFHDRKFKLEEYWYHFGETTFLPNAELGEASERGRRIWTDNNYPLRILPSDVQNTSPWSPPRSPPT